MHASAGQVRTVNLDEAEGTVLVFAGKSFFKKKKQPIPVDLTGKDWAGQVRRATEATYMFHTGGTCLNIRSAAAQLNSSSALASLLFNRLFKIHHAAAERLRTCAWLSLSGQKLCLLCWC